MDEASPPSTPTPQLVALFGDLHPPGGQLQEGESVGRFTIEKKLGAGGMGVVYAALDSGLKRRVALKLLTPGPGQTKASLLREAQLLARLSHQNIVTVFEADETDGRVWISMELLEGETLAAWHRKSTHSWDDVLAVMLPVGHGLAAAHAAGLAHGDLKPANIMIGSDGRPRIFDFGLARERSVADTTASTSTSEQPWPTDPSGPTTQATHHGGGTPAYMAPEQRRRVRADALTDQYSYCVTFWELLSGQRPFKPSEPGDANRDVSEAHLVMPAKRRVPTWLVDSLRKGLRGERDARWPSMTALLAALTRGLADVQRRRARWRLTAVGVGVLASTLLGLQAWSLLGLVLRPGRTDLIELEYDASALLRESPVNLPATAMSVRVPAGRPAPKFCKGTNPLAAEALA